MVQVKCVFPRHLHDIVFLAFQKIPTNFRFYLHHLHFLISKELKIREIDRVQVMTMTFDLGAGDLHFKPLPDIPSCKPRPFSFNFQEHRAGDLHL